MMIVRAYKGDAKKARSTGMAEFECRGRASRSVSKEIDDALAENDAMDRGAEEDPARLECTRSQRPAQKKWDVQAAADGESAGIVSREKIVAGFIGNVQRDRDGEGDPRQTKVPVHHGGYLGTG